MRHRIGFDIGGTKIAGAIYNETGTMLAEAEQPTPNDYVGFLSACEKIALSLKEKTGEGASIGVGLPGMIDQQMGSVVVTPNIAYLVGAPLRDDLAKILKQEVRLSNDANCAALAEATHGAGVGYDAVLGLILGTGVGSALVYQGAVMNGVNSFCGEIGHLPLPYRTAEDGPMVSCGCGQTGCIDKSVSGGGLERLYHMMTGKNADAKTIAELAQKKDSAALRVLDHYYETVAKAMVTAIHSFDPDVIVVSGGLSQLPALYDEVPKRWGKYVYCKNPKTKFIPAQMGPRAGLRGAAWLWG